MLTGSLYPQVCAAPEQAAGSCGSLGPAAHGGWEHRRVHPVSCGYTGRAGVDVGGAARRSQRLCPFRAQPWLWSRGCSCS